MKVYKEIIPLTQKDIFIIINSEKVCFEYPIHYHSEYELTLVMNSSGNRVIGDSVEKYYSNDLVLIGPELYHKWDDSDVPPKRKNNTQVITIQFSKDLFNNSFFLKESFLSIKKLLKNSQRGIKYTDKTYNIVSKKIQNLASLKNFDAVIEFLKILHLLSISKDRKCLVSKRFNSMKDYKGDKVSKIYKYILANFTDLNLRIDNLAYEMNMSPSAFGHFFKKTTNKNFTQFVIDLRLSHASKLLLESSLSISEIAFISGFNSIANFNRLFKKNKYITPRQYRKNLISNTEFNWKNQLTSNQFIPS